MSKIHVTLYILNLEYKTESLVFYQYICMLTTFEIERQRTCTASGLVPSTCVVALVLLVQNFTTARGHPTRSWSKVLRIGQIDKHTILYVPTIAASTRLL